jgi:hypothetical protein
MNATRRNTLALFALAVLAVVAAFASPVLAGKGKTYGEPLGGTDTIKISELIANADEYAGKTVRVEGLVTGVCEKRGCWITLASDKEFEELRIKAQDGVIVFPVEAKGRHAVAEGVFTKIQLTMEQTLARAEHHAEEHGEEYDPSTITEPAVWYQIDVTGAVID